MSSFYLLCDLSAVVVLLYVALVAIPSFPPTARSA
jgi:hypothetical protein